MLTYIEEFIEFISGDREANGNKKANTLWAGSEPSPINLARYDVDIVSSLSQQSLRGIGYTDRQLELAKKIVIKYRRQLANLPEPILVPDDFPVSLPIRVVDRTFSAKIVDDQIHIKFPYNAELVTALKKYAETASGSVRYIRDEKIWKLSLNEFSVNWVVALAPSYNIILDPEISRLHELILGVESRPFAIELVSTDQGFDIPGAATSLREMIDNKLGGFGTENLLALVDNSAILGYTVSEQVQEQLRARLGQEYDAADAELLEQLIMNRRPTINLVTQGLDIVVKYARLVNRLPIYSYEGQAVDITEIKQTLPEIQTLNARSYGNIKPRLLLTTTVFMIGRRRAGWLQSAEKIILLT